MTRTQEESQAHRSQPTASLYHGGDEEFRPYDDDDAHRGYMGWLAAMKLLLNSAEPEPGPSDGYSPTWMSESVGAYASVSSGTSPMGTSLV